jgi:hypothetical protein
LTIGNTEIQRIIRKYFENLYFTELENIKEMSKFVVIYDQQRLKQEDISNQNKSIISTEIETVIKSPNKENSRTRWIYC